MGQTLLPRTITRTPKCEYCGRLPNANVTCDGCGAPVKIVEPDYTEIVKEFNRIHTATMQQMRTPHGYTGFSMPPHGGVSSFLSGFVDGYSRSRRLR